MPWISDQELARLRAQAARAGQAPNAPAAPAPAPSSAPAAPQPAEQQQYADWNRQLAERNPGMTYHVGGNYWTANAPTGAGEQQTLKTFYASQKDLWNESMYQDQTGQWHPRPKVATGVPTAPASGVAPRPVATGVPTAPASGVAPRPVATGVPTAPHPKPAAPPKPINVLGGRYGYSAPPEPSPAPRQVDKGPNNVDWTNPIQPDQPNVDWDAPRAAESPDRTASPEPVQGTPTRVSTPEEQQDPTRPPKVRRALAQTGGVNWIGGT